MTSPAAFAKDARRLESLGWDYGFIHSSPLLARDPYVMLAAALQATDRIRLGPLIENPVMRHPAVIAGSIATVDRTGTRASMAWHGRRRHSGSPDGQAASNGGGAGRFRPSDSQALGWRALGSRRGPARQACVTPRLCRSGSPPAARARYAWPARWQTACSSASACIEPTSPTRWVWFGKVPKKPAGTRLASQSAASSTPCWFQADRAMNPLAVSLASAAPSRPGYYEYSPMLFDTCGVEWNGPPAEELKRRVWPDFHHARDLEAAGDVGGLPRRRRRGRLRPARRC